MLPVKNKILRRKMIWYDLVEIIKNWTVVSYYSYSSFAPCRRRHQNDDPFIVAYISNSSTYELLLVVRIRNKTSLDGQKSSLKGFFSVSLPSSKISIGLSVQCAFFFFFLKLSCSSFSNRNIFFFT